VLVPEIPHVPALSASEVESLLLTVPTWHLEAGELVRIFKFEDFRASLRFVNQVGDLAEASSHHPDIDIRYNRVRPALVTPDAGGLTEKHFSLANQADRLI